MRTSDLAKISFGSLVRPAEETRTGQPQVEQVLGYVTSTPAGTLLLNTGLGHAGADTDAYYRPRRVGVEAAMATIGLNTTDIDLVVNCHLHFAHIGGNPLFAGTPLYCQRQEFDTAMSGGYTLPELVEFPGATWELLDGESEVAAGVHIIPTPGHVDGHQSVVLECDDGTVVLAGEAHEEASQWSADVLATQATGRGHQRPLPPASPWMARLLKFDPIRVFFAHDSAVWVP